MQTNIFDYLEGQHLRDIGIVSVEFHNHGWVQKAREKAIEIAIREGEVTSDLVLAAIPRPPETHPNSVGAIFKDKRFRHVGYTKTIRTKGHAREIKIWALA